MAMFCTETKGAKRLLTDSRNFIQITEVPKSVNDVVPIEYNRLGDSHLTRWMDENGFDGTCMVYVCHDFPHDEANADRLETLTRMVMEGIQLDIEELKGKVYKNFGRSASGERTCTTVFFEEKFRKAFLIYYTLGQPKKFFTRISGKKGILYVQQASSATKTWENAHDSQTRELLPEPDIMGTVLCTDAKFTRAITNVYKVANGTVKTTAIAVAEKDSDGVIYILIDVEIEFEPFTVRGFPFLKGLAIVISRKTLKRIFGNRPIIDKWKHEHEIDKISMIWIESAFKGCKVWRTYVEFEDYKRRCKAAGMRLLVCKQAHPYSIKRIPTQEMQAIMPTPAEERLMVWKATGDMHDIETIPGLISMIPDKNEKKVAQMMNTYLDEPLVKEGLQMQHLSRVKTVLSGCMPKSVYYVFAAPDTYAVFCHFYGIEPKPILKPGEVTLNHKNVKYTEVSYDEETGKKIIGKNRMIVMRNPCGTRGILYKCNVTVPEKYKGLYPGTACYFSVHDLSMRVLSMDYDGDTVAVMSVKNIGASKAYSSALFRALKTTDYKCVYFDQDTVPAVYSREQAKIDTINATAAEIGLVANAITRLIDLQSALYKQTEERIRNARSEAQAKKIKEQADKDMANLNEKLIVLEAALTLIIDSAKNGANEDVQKTVARARAIINETVKTVPAPMHTFWKKMVSINDIIENDYDLQKTIEAKMDYRKDGTPKFVRRDSWMGRYTAAVENEVTVKLPIDQFVAEGQIEKWCPEGLQKLSAQWRAFCKVPPKAAPYLSFKGIGYNTETHETDWSSTYIGQMFGNLLGLRKKYSNHKLLKEQLDLYVPATRKAIFAHARHESGFDMQTTISTIVMYFYTKSHTTDKQHEKITLRDIKDCIWLLFGNEIVENVKANLGLPQDFELEDSGEEPVADDEIVYSDDGEYTCFMTDEQYEEMYNNTSEEESGFYSDEGWFDND